MPAEEMYWEGGLSLRVLVAVQDAHGLYRDTLARAIRQARPYYEVAEVGAEALQAEVARFDPDLVISSLSKPATIQNGRLTWAELSIDPQQRSRFCVDGQPSQPLNPSLEELLGTADQTERLLAAKSSAKGRAARAYEWFWQLPVPIVLVVLWLAGAAIVVFCAVALYLYWLALRAVA